MARPSEYKEEYIDKVFEYLKTCEDEETEYHKTRGEKSDTYERILKVKLPSIEGFSIYLDVSKQSLYSWAEKDDRFMDALGRIEKAQKDVIMRKGLSGEYNSTIAKLILSANHGMREGTDVTTGGKPIKISFDDSFAE